MKGIYNDVNRAVIKGRGPGISPGYYERGARLLSKENRRKIEPKETPSCLIPRLLVVFTRQLEILVTTLCKCKRMHQINMKDQDNSARNSFKTNDSRPILNFYKLR